MSFHENSALFVIMLKIHPVCTVVTNFYSPAVPSMFPHFFKKRIQAQGKYTDTDTNSLPKGFMFQLGKKKRNQTLTSQK